MLVTPPGMLFTTALLVIYAIYAFMIWSIEDSLPLLAGALIATVATYGTAMVRPWSRYLVYLITTGFVAKLGLSIWQANKAGYFEFQFDSIASAGRSLLPEAAMALLGFLCCGLVWRQFPSAALPNSSAGSEGTRQHIKLGLLSHRFSNEYLWFGWVLIAIACGSWLQSNVYLNHDVAWIGHSAGWLLNGARFGRDILDANPPLAWILALPAAALASSGLLSEPVAIRSVIWIYVLLCSVLTARALASRCPDVKATNGTWRAVFVGAVAVAAAGSFGQREYLCVVLVMPYLALSAARAHDDAAVESSLSIPIGLLAGIGFSIKPYFLAVPALIEGALALRLGWRSMMRPESLALACTTVGYVVSVLVFMPDYVSYALPLARAAYWAYDSESPLFVLTRFLPTFEFTAAGLMVAACTWSWSRQQTVLLLSIIGFSISYFAQGKGFLYHVFPAHTCAIIFFACSVTVGFRSSIRRFESQPLIRTAAIAALIVLTIPAFKSVHDDVLAWYAHYNFKWGKGGLYRTAIIETVNRYASGAGDHYYALSTHPFPAFPTGSYTDARWAGNACCQWITPAALKAGEISEPARREQVLKAEQVQRRIVVEDMRRTAPQIVFVETGQQRLGLGGRMHDDIHYYSQDPEFAEMWQKYSEAPAIGPLRVYVRTQ